MATPYVGEIRMFAGNFAPVGWALCQGQIMSISENEVLFQLIGTTYGGDGESTFALPNLQSRVPLHIGSGFPLGAAGGVETVTLTTNQIPIHTHTAMGFSNPANQSNPSQRVWAQSSAVSPYSNASPSEAMNAAAISQAGGNQPHDNMLPYLCINFIIALFGIFPSQS